MGYIIENRPRSQVHPQPLYVMVIDPVEGQTDGFQEDQNGHHVMYLENRMFRLLQNEHPEQAWKEEKNGKGAVEGWQGHLVRWQVAADVLLDDLDDEVEGEIAVRIVIGTVMEVKVVEAFLRGVGYVHGELEVPWVICLIQFWNCKLTLVL